MIPRLCAISPGVLRDTDAAAFLPRAAAAADAGLPALLLREPALSDKAYLRLAAALRELYAGRLLLLHDRPHLVAAAGADGVHLSFRGLPAAEVRDMLRAPLLVGTSAHAGDAPALHAAGDYCLLGPVRDTASKRGWKDPIGFDGLRREIARLAKPCLAVGGLGPAHAPAALEAGAAGVAALGGIWEAEGPGERVREYLAACLGAAVKEN